MARTKQPYGLSKQISLIRKKREIHRTASVGSYHDDKTGLVLEKVELENLQRSQTDFNRKLEAIQTRILTTISNYEEDRSLVNQAALEQFMRFKFLSDIDALQEYIENKEFRMKLQNEMAVLIIGSKDVSQQRLSLLKGIYNALENVSARNDGSFEYVTKVSDAENFLKRMDESLSCTREFLEKLDQLSPEIIQLINNTKNDVSYAKNRKLDKRLLEMKQTVRHLNQKLKQNRKDMQNLDVELLKYKTSEFLKNAKIKELEEEIEFLRKKSAQDSKKQQKDFDVLLQQKKQIVQAQEEQILSLECYISNSSLEKVNQERKPVDAQSSMKITEINSGSVSEVRSGSKLNYYPHITTPDFSGLETPSKSDRNLCTRGSQTLLDEDEEFEDYIEETFAKLPARPVTNPEGTGRKSGTFVRGRLSSFSDRMNKIRAIESLVKAHHSLIEFVADVENATQTSILEPLGVEKFTNQEICDLQNAEFKKTITILHRLGATIRNSTLEGITEAMLRNRFEVNYIQKSEYPETPAHDVEAESPKLTRVKKIKTPTLQEELSQKKSKSHYDAIGTPKVARKSKISAAKKIKPSMSEGSHLRRDHAITKKSTVAPESIEHVPEVSSNSETGKSVCETSTNSYKDPQVAQDQYKNDAAMNAGDSGDSNHFTIDALTVHSTGKDPTVCETRARDSRESHATDNTEQAIRGTSRESLEAALSTITKTSSHVMSEMGKMNGLVRQWLEYLKGTPEAVKIFTNMEKIRLLEQRKIHFQTSFDKAIGDLRDEMQTLVRQAMRDCRINDLRKFEPDLVNLEIQGKSKYVIVKLTPQEDSRPESVISEKVKVAVEGQGQDDRNEVTLGPSELSLVGSFCLKDNIQIGKQYSHHSTIPNPPSDSPKILKKQKTKLGIPKLLELDIKRSTIKGSARTIDTPKYYPNKD